MFTNKKYKYLVFDLDGTLLDSLNDIVNALNLSLEDVGHYYKVTYEEGKTFIGAGAKKLVERCAKKSELPIDKMQSFIDAMTIHYVIEQRKTKAFPGEREVIENLKRKGYELFILSNKPNDLLNEVISLNYDLDTFTYMMGKKEEFPPKPNPTSFEYLINKFGLEKDKVLYIGDSHYDIEFAANAGVDVAICTFGYEDYTPGLLLNADVIFKSVEDIDNYF